MKRSGGEVARKRRVWECVAEGERVLWIRFGKSIATLSVMVLAPTSSSKLGADFTPATASQ